MNSSDENHFQTTTTLKLYTNFRTKVFFILNTLPRRAPFSQLPTCSGGADFGVLVLRTLTKTHTGFFRPLLDKRYLLYNYTYSTRTVELRVK